MDIKSLGNSYGNPSIGLGSSKQPNTTQVETESPTNDDNRSAVLSSSHVTISQSATGQLGEVGSAPSFKDVGMAAREKLNTLKQQGAEKSGTTMQLVNLHDVDYSTFSDQDLAAMKLNSSKNFSDEEQHHAQAVLNERLRVSLETYRGVTELGDRRGHTKTIDALYKQMTPEVRSALGWTPVMMAQNDYLMALDEGKFGEFPMSAVLENLQATQAEGGLTFKLELWNDKGDTLPEEYRKKWL